MASRVQQSRGVSGTIDAFNFIRRIGFPPTPEVVSAFVTLAVLPTFLGLPFSGLSLTSTLTIASFVIVLPTISGELINSTILLRGDPVLNFRRLMGMEIISWSTILALVPFCSLLGALLSNSGLWADGLFIAIAVSLPVRFLTIFAMSSISQVRKLAASITVPTAAFCLYIISTNYFIPTPAASTQGAILPGMLFITAGLIVLFIGTIVSGTGVVRIIRRVDKQGGPEIGDAPIGLFRDFLRHWLKGEAEPLESRLAVLGRNGRIEVSTLAFEGASGQKSCVIISNFHPGPYRDLGSGGLPSMLQSGVEGSNGSIVMVPHGISNHEYNIISHNDILQLVRDTEVNYPSVNNRSGASILVREASRDAKASAQIFGDTVLLTLTLAPVDMEDIPTRVKEALDAAAKAKRLHVIIADAHNCLRNQVSITAAQADMLQDAGAKALNAVSQMPRLSFKVGAASNPLEEFRLEDGIGPGGLSVLAVECQGQRVAYVTIDGNNMQAGFRDVLLKSIKSEGIDEGEVMTTDTHLVAGVVRSPLGYHPVGEGVNKELLVSIVRETVRSAINGMNEGSSGFATFQLDLRVLGSASFRGITSFVGRVARTIGRSFVLLELLVFSLSVVILVVL
jgi:putative membrane protein